MVDAMFTERKHSIVKNENDSDSNEDFICPDKYVFALLFNRKIIPLGKKILIRRDTSEQIEKGFVVGAEAQPSTDQSLSGTVEAIGILPRKLNKRKKPTRWKVDGIGIGDQIMLDRWSENWVEVSMDGIYYLIVDEADLLYKLQSSDCNE